MHFATIAEQLGKTGLCVWPNFLSPESLLKIRVDLKRIQKAQGFRRAGTGQGKGNEVRELVRRDEVHWIERAVLTKAQSILWSKIDQLKQAFNRTLYLGLSEFKGHYAVYPAGGFYKRHLDCFQQDDARVVSLVLYLNPNWKLRDGGQLRIYGATSHVDVQPIGGTLVCFMSRESEHEVLLSHGTRLSFTGWFNR